jgi:hypothetical protein
MADTTEPGRETRIDSKRLQVLARFDESGAHRVFRVAWIRVMFAARR